MQFEGGNKTIPTVVAFATDNANGLKLKMLQSKFGYRCASIFHQGERRYAVLLRGGTVNPAHLLRGNDLHVRPGAVFAARDSSLVICAGLPITIRKSPSRIGSLPPRLKRVSPPTP